MCLYIILIDSNRQAWKAGGTTRSYGRAQGGLQIEMEQAEGRRWSSSIQLCSRKNGRDDRSLGTGRYCGP